MRDYQMAHIRNTWKAHLIVGDDVHLGFRIVEVQRVYAVANVRTKLIEVVEVAGKSGLREEPVRLTLEGWPRPFLLPSPW